MKHPRVLIRTISNGVKWHIISSHIRDSGMPAAVWTLVEKYRISVWDWILPLFLFRYLSKSRHHWFARLSLTWRWFPSAFVPTRMIGKLLCPITLSYSERRLLNAESAYNQWELRFTSIILHQVVARQTQASKLLHFEVQRTADSDTPYAFRYKCPKVELEHFQLLRQLRLP